MVQLAPAAMLAPQLLLDTENPALAVMLLKLSAAFCELVSVTGFEELVLPHTPPISLPD